MANRAAERARAILFVFAILLLAGCNGAPRPSPPETTPSMDHVVQQAPRDPVNFLHKTFPLKTSARFEFEVPEHCTHPRLQGNFRAFVSQSSGATISDKTADVKLLVLTNQEFAEFEKGKSGTATYSIDASHEQKVDFNLNSTSEQEQKYYLVFSNVGGARNKFVDADFMISFE